MSSVGGTRGAETSFGGARIVSFESRRAREMASLVERHGGVAVSAPSLREVALDDPPEARRLADELARGDVDALVLMTGVGTRALLGLLERALGADALEAALARAVVVVRGPKPAAVLKERGRRPIAPDAFAAGSAGSFVVVPEPNTWREVLDVVEGLRARVAAEGKPWRRVHVQEHGAPSAALYDALRARGADVTPVPVYRWALPEDTAPLRAALHEIATGAARVALFTSASQVEHALFVAREEGIEVAVVAALRAGVVASIGPVCSEALRESGLEVDVEPEHSKMGQLVKAAAERAAAILGAKQMRG